MVTPNTCSQQPAAALWPQDHKFPPWLSSRCRHRLWILDLPPAQKSYLARSTRLHLKPSGISQILMGLHGTNKSFHPFNSQTEKGSKQHQPFFSHEKPRSFVSWSSDFQSLFPMTQKWLPLVNSSAEFWLYKNFLDICNDLKMGKTSLNLC